MKKGITTALIGLIIVAIGVIVIGNAFTWWDIDLFFDGWWALVAMIGFLIAIINDGPHFYNIIGFLIFGFLLAHYQLPGFKEVKIWLIIVGVTVLLIGGKIVLGVIMPKKYTPKNSATVVSDSGSDYESCTFSSFKKSYAGRTFSGGKFSCAFGDYIIDLCGATIAEGAVLKADCSFGSIKIFVDSGTRVVLKKGTCFGSVDFQGTESDSADLTIEADSSFGSIKIIQK